jgi:hypothetical protein
MQVHSWGIAIVDTAPARFFASVVPVVRILHGSDICSLEREAEMRPHQRKYLTRELVSGGFGLTLGVAGMYLAYLAIIYSSPYPPTDDVAAVARLIWDLIIAAVTLFVICGVGGIVILAEAALQYFAYRRPLA